MPILLHKTILMSGVLLTTENTDLDACFTLGR
jgi:hypothetical protein